MEIYLATKNKGKILAARHAFASGNMKLSIVEKDYPEIQADSSLEIARHAAIQIADDLGKPTIREDHSLYLSGLGKIPGPYMNYFDRRLSESDILKLYKNIPDRGGYFEVATVLVFPKGKIFESVFKVHFTLSFEAKGNLQTGWNRIIVLKGETRTLAEYPETERVPVWNRGYLNIIKQLLDYLPKHPKQSS